ncbi:MAG: thymidylate synthase [Candidatus Argoarchaeum ethanivorans]|uniref:Thymidylate synthase n=1 Tax=Candidatus Argoarchaeum ethanivorans TaxID=2608793 RepID=A0A8B3S1Y6_9EURY|nr:MAG: thymidylate synthase [Candidatus Argoarchaeum ethanivorans]
MEIKGRTISEVWEKSIQQIIKDDSPLIPTQHATMAKELQNMIMIVDEPFGEPRVSNKYSFPEKFQNEYSEFLLEPYAKSDILHSRICEYGESKLNQIEQCIKILQEDWYSRRAVITLWNPNDDLYSSFPPCICSFQIMIRKNKVDLVVVMRSNDAWLSAHPDMIALTNLQKKISKLIGLECGRYVHHAVSYHIYEYDYPMALKVFFV